MNAYGCGSFDVIITCKIVVISKVIVSPHRISVCKFMM